MGNVDDSSASSFEDVGDKLESRSLNSNKEEASDELMSGLGGNLGKAVADQVIILVEFILKL